MNWGPPCAGNCITPTDSYRGGSYNGSVHLRQIVHSGQRFCGRHHSGSQNSRLHAFRMHAFSAHEPGSQHSPENAGASPFLETCISRHFPYSTVPKSRTGAPHAKNAHESVPGGPPSLTLPRPVRGGPRGTICCHANFNICRLMPFVMVLHEP